MVSQVSDPTQAKRNEFEELYASANEELYSGCDYVTRLDFMAKFTYFKVKAKLTDSIFNEMLEFFQNVFPTAKGYKLPPSYYEIKKNILKSIGDCTEPGKMQHPVDGRAWKDFDTKYLDFAAEPRNVRLGLAADGFNPFGNLNIDVYLRPLIDDLKDLWAKPGVETIDFATCLKFNMRAMVLWTINDFPARSSLSGWSGQVKGQARHMSADVARGHGGDGGGDDRPPPHQIPTGCGGCLGNRGKGTRKPNLGGRRAGRLHTRQETRNLGLKAITDKSGPVPIRFEFGDRETLMPLGDHAAHWANYLGELVRELPLHHPSWRQVPPEQKAGVMAKIGAHGLTASATWNSDRWPQIYAAIQQHLQKIYNGKKAALKEMYWIHDSDGTYDPERIRQIRPSHISEVDWDAHIAFWNDLKNLARDAQNKQNRAKSTVMESSATREYPSLIHTFFLTHTVGGVFLNAADKALYDDMLRLQGLGYNTPSDVPYTEDEIMAIVHRGKQRGHIPGVGRVLPGQGTVIPPSPSCTHSSDVAMLKKREKVLTKKLNMFMKLFRSDDKFSQMLTQLESQPEYGGGSGSGGCGDDEPGDDEDGGEDEDDS
ncbi:RNA-directed DNA polymerase, eukaryota [Tanacetum coccineum]